MPVIPLAIHTYLLDRWWVSERTAPGVWSNPVLTIDTRGSPQPITNVVCSAGALIGLDSAHRGIVAYSVEGDFNFYGNGIPDPDHAITFSGDGGITPRLPCAAATVTTLPRGFWSASYGAFWIPANNAYYLLLQNLNNNTYVVVKSTDAGATWTECDAAHHPTYTANFFGAFRRGTQNPNLICGVYRTNAGTGEIALITFDMVSETWTGPFAQFTGVPVINGFNGYTPFNGVYQFANGDFAIYFLGTFLDPNDKLYYWLWSAGSATWGTPVPVFDSGGSDFGVGFGGVRCANSVVEPDGETIWLFYYKGGSASASTYQAECKKITHSGSLSGVLFTFPDYSPAQEDGLQHGAIIGNEIFVGYDNSIADAPNQVWVAPLSTGVFVEEDLPIPMGEGADGPSCVFIVSSLETGPVDPFTSGAKAHSEFVFLGPHMTLACPSGSAAVGVPYSHSFVVTGGTAPYVFAIIAGSLPPGLTLNTSSGLVSGTPTTSGMFAYTVQVTDANGLTATASCGIGVPGTATCAGANDPCAGIMSQPGTDVQFELRRVYMSIAPHGRIPVRGS